MGQTKQSRTLREVSFHFMCSMKAWEILGPPWFSENKSVEERIFSFRSHSVLIASDFTQQWQFKETHQRDFSVFFFSEAGRYALTEKQFSFYLPEDEHPVITSGKVEHADSLVTSFPLWSLNSSAIWYSRVEDLWQIQVLSRVIQCNFKTTLLSKYALPARCLDTVWHNSG